MTDSTKFMTTCARNCEARSYQITVRQQAAKILELHAYLDDIKNQLIDALSTNYELEKELANSKDSVKRNAHRIVERDEKIAELERKLNCAEWTVGESGEFIAELEAQNLEMQSRIDELCPKPSDEFQAVLDSIPAID
jgi:chromosome segregation ATPase